MFNFEKLEVWQKAIDFADLIYKQTRIVPVCKSVLGSRISSAERRFQFLQISLRVPPVPQRLILRVSPKSPLVQYSKKYPKRSSHGVKASSVKISFGPSTPMPKN